jgi:hypothetical protein
MSKSSDLESIFLLNIPMACILSSVSAFLISKKNKDTKITFHSGS